jgi:hypothetical protein
MNSGTAISGTAISGTAISGRKRETGGFLCVLTKFPGGTSNVSWDYLVGALIVFSPSR